MGLQLNLSKSACLTKGTWPDQYVAVLSSFGTSIKRKLKYLGILLGHVTSEEAYAPVLARATLRAHFMNRLPPTREERVALSQEWVLPVFVFPARGYFPADEVVAKLSVISKVALRLNSWGPTLPTMAMPPTLGGNHLPQPRKYLLWQHTTPFILSRVEPQGVPALSGRHFEAWAHHHGVPLDGRYLPWFQLEPIPWKTYPFLGMPCKAFSLLKKKSASGHPQGQTDPGDASVALRLVQRHPQQHVLLASNDPQRGPYCVAYGQPRGGVPRMWATLYEAGLGLLHARRRPKPSIPSEATPSFWLAWNQRPMLCYLMNLSPEAPRQQPEVWQAWQKLLLPPADRELMQTALWKKLMVGVRLANWQPAGTACPICGLLETTQHALTACKYFSVAAHVASRCMGPAATEHGPETDPTIIRVPHDPTGDHPLVCSPGGVVSQVYA